MLLTRTLRHLEENHNIAERRIRAIKLNNYFTVVVLDDGSVGACMSYYRLAPPVLIRLQKQIQHLLPKDPLLIDYLFERKSEYLLTELPVAQRETFFTSLQATVVSALSARALRDGGDATFQSSYTPPFDPFDGARTALVIGFGGDVHALARSGQVEELRIADLTYAVRKQEMDAVVAHYRRRKKMKINFDGNSESLRQIGEHLKANPAALDELTTDPQKFLGTLGLVVDGDTARAIQAHVTRAGMQPSPASVVHIDVS